MKIVDMLSYALEYHDEGRIVIPISKDKVPLVEYRDLLNNPPSREQIISWWEAIPDANIAEVVGDKIVVDVEKGGKYDYLPKTVFVKTGGGGYHFHYQLDPSLPPIKNAVRKKDLTDIRTGNGLVVLPPSLHKNGRQYEWGEIPRTSELTTFPYELFEESDQGILQASQAPRKDWEKLFAKKITEGNRNDTATKLIGKMLHDISPELWKPVVWPFVSNWNSKKCIPPLSEEELKRTFESICKAQRKKPKKETQQEKIVKMVLDSKAVLFKDQYNKAFIAPNGHGNQVLSLNSSEYQKKLSYEAYKKFGKSFGSSVINAALSTLEGKALFEGNQVNLAVRIAQRDDAIWYDLCSQKAVRIDKQGVSVEDSYDFLFRNFSHQKSQPEPAEDGNIEDILQFFNIPGYVPGQPLSGPALLLVVWIVLAFVPGIPHAILVLQGPQGSGKSSFFRLLKRLIDPSAVQTFFLHRDTRELIQQASHHSFLPFDNISYISQEQSDMLSRFVTGEGTSKRELYTNDSDFIYNFKIVLGLNGITMAIEKGDLFDRSILLPMNRIQKFKEEQVIDAEFEEIKPFLLGSVFEVLSKAMSKVDEVKVPISIRLADFARWGCAVAESLGYSSEQFIDAYKQNMNLQNQETIDASPVAKCIVKLMENKDEWKGTPTQLYGLLEQIGEELRVNRSSRFWPKDPRSVWKRITEVMPNLDQAHGISADRERNTQRSIILSKKEKGANDDTVDNDDNTSLSSDDISDIFHTSS